MKKLNTLFLPAIVSLALSASCSMAGDNQTANDLSQAAEPLYGIQLKQGEIAINVKSNGCTDAAHFDVQVNAENDRQTLLIVRNKPDRCRKMPKIIRIELELPTTAENNYRLVNPMQSG